MPIWWKKLPFHYCPQTLTFYWIVYLIMRMHRQDKHNVNRDLRNQYDKISGMGLHLLTGINMDLENCWAALEHQHWRSLECNQNISISLFPSWRNNWHWTQMQSLWKSEIRNFKRNTMVFGHFEAKFRWPKVQWWTKYERNKNLSKLYFSLEMVNQTTG